MKRTDIKKLCAYILLLLLLELYSAGFVQADLPGAHSGVDTVSENVYLGGNFIEFGIGQNGSSGKAKSNTKISGFYGRQGSESGTSSAPGFLGDADGFGNGADLRIDYFLPGTAAEGWGVSLNNGSLVHARNSHAYNDITYAFVNESSGDTLRTTGTGTWNGLQIDHAISFGVNRKYVTYQVTLTNNSGSDMTDVSYMRSFDPDNTVDMGGSYTTVNTVVADIANDGKVIVEALSVAGDSYNTAAGTQALIRYYSTDARAIPRFATSLMDTQADTVVNGATAKDTTQTADKGISIGFDIGNLSNTASESFTFYVVMRSQSGSVATFRNTDYAFASSDFDYVDPEDTLNNAQIKTLPTDGTLYVDDNSDGVVDGGEAVSADDVITTANLAKLKYKPDTDWVGSDAFTFLSNSAGSAITMSVKVAGVDAGFDMAATETNLDSRSITATLTATAFKDSSLSTANFTLNNAPSGLTIESVSYTDTTHCTVNLAFSGDFDSDISTLGLTIASAELGVSSDLSSPSDLSITATNDAESITIADDGDIQEGAEDGEVITVTLTGGVFVSSLTAGNWTVSNLPAGVTKAAVGRTSATIAAITLTGNASDDYDTDITNVTVEFTTDEYADSTGDDVLSANTGVTLIATVEPSTTTTTAEEVTGGGTTCAFSMSPENENLDASGGSGSFFVTTKDKCLWSSHASKPWITVSNDSMERSGSGTVSYTVAVNTTLENRYGTIAAGGQEFMIAQKAGNDASATTTVQGGIDVTTTTTILINTTTTSSSTMTTVSGESNADFIGLPLAGDAPLLVKFVNTYKGKDVDRLWDFGDGEISTVGHPEHTYSAPGIYAVTLTVTGSGWDDTMVKSDYIVVSEAPYLSAHFNALPVKGIAPLKVVFSDSSEGPIANREWDFGDGSALSTENNPVHTYEEPGLYTVALTVSDASGAANTIEKVNYILVSGMAAEADFDASPLEGQAPLSVVFTDMSKGFVVDREWNFGDGSRDVSGKNPQHTYKIPGLYTVCLKASGPAGSSCEIKEAYINVKDSAGERMRHKISGTITETDPEDTDVVLTGHGIQYTTKTDNDGSYIFGGVMMGIYSVTPCKKGTIFGPVSREVNIAFENAEGIDFVAQTAEPVFKVLYASPPLSPADGTTPITLLAKVSHLLGLEAIESVTIDLTPIGGEKSVPMHDDGTHGDETPDDAVFSLQTTIADGTHTGLQMLNVRSVDTQGNEAVGVLAAGVCQIHAGNIEACGIWEENVQVPKFTQELVITLDRGQGSSVLLELEIFRPFGLGWRWWKTLSISEMQTEYRIKNPNPGTWHYRITGACTEGDSGNEALMQTGNTDLTVQSIMKGIGSISGRVTDTETGNGISHALVKVGKVRIWTDEKGYYSSPVSTGAYRLHVHALGHIRLRKSVVIEEYGNTVLDLVVDRKFWFEDNRYEE